MEKTQHRHYFLVLRGKQLHACVIVSVIKLQLTSISQQWLLKIQMTSIKILKSLLEIYSAVRSGFCPWNLPVRNSVLIFYIRWLTAANRTFRLYVFIENHTTEVKQFYSSWRPMCLYGLTSRGIILLLTNNACVQDRNNIVLLTKKMQDLIHSVTERNTFYGHPENFLLSMITDEKEHIRELGFKLIWKAV